MTTQEFSLEFDILYNNIMSNQAPGLDDYEKSVFLTRAMEEIIIQFYSGKNQFLESFENTEEIRRCLSNLVTTEIYHNGETTKGLSDNSVIYQLPPDLWFIIYESVLISKEETKCGKSIELMVVPTTHDEYFKISKNPFKRPNNRKVLRIDIDDNRVELITSYNSISQYSIRYIRKPKPIILSDIGDFEINGEHTKTECELNSVIHKAILTYAVNLAKMTYYASNGKQE